MSTEKESRKLQTSNIVMAKILIAFFAFFVLFAPFIQAEIIENIQGVCQSTLDVYNIYGGYGWCNNTCAGNVDDCATGFFVNNTNRHYNYGGTDCEICMPSACELGQGSGIDVPCCNCDKDESYEWEVGTRCGIDFGNGCVFDVFDESMVRVTEGDPYCKWDSAYIASGYRYSCSRCHCVTCKSGYTWGWSGSEWTCLAPCYPSPCQAHGQGEMCFPGTNVAVQCVERPGGCYYINPATIIQDCGENQYCSDTPSPHCENCATDLTGDGLCRAGCEAIDVDCNCEPNGVCGVGCGVEEDPDCGTPCNPGACDGVCVPSCGNDPDCCINNDNICCGVCVGGSDNDCGTGYTFNYDPVGNLIATMNLDKNENVSFGYDAFNRLINFSKKPSYYSKAYYFYDYQGRRIKKINPQKSEITFYVYNGNDVLLEESFVCGDAGGDGDISASDIVYLINYLFIQGPPPNPLWIADANGDGDISTSDVVYLINYLFIGGPPPCPNLFEGSTPPQQGSGGTGNMGLVSGSKNPDGSVNVWIKGNFDTDVSGLEFEITYDNSKLEIFNITTTELTSNMNIYKKESNGRKIIAILDQSGTNYVQAKSSGKLVSLKVKGVKLQQVDLSSLKLSNITVYSKNTTASLAMTLLKNDLSSVEKPKPVLQKNGTGGMVTASTSSMLDMIFGWLEMTTKNFTQQGEKHE